MNLSPRLTGATESLRFIGQPSGTGGSFAEAANSVNSTDYNGCVNVASSAVTSDSTLSCNITGTAASAAVTAMDADRVYYAADAIATLVTETTSSTTLAWSSGADIFTGTH